MAGIPFFFLGTARRKKIIRARATKSEPPLLFFCLQNNKPVFSALKDSKNTFALTRGKYSIFLGLAPISQNAEIPPLTEVIKRSRHEQARRLFAPAALKQDEPRHRGAHGGFTAAQLVCSSELAVAHRAVPLLWYRDGGHCFPLAPPRRAPRPARRPATVEEGATRAAAPRTARGPPHKARRRPRSSRAQRAQRSSSPPPPRVRHHRHHRHRDRPHRRRRAGARRGGTA